MFPAIFGISLLLASSQLALGGVGCGRQHSSYSPSLTQRIVNGKDATPHTWPWAVFHYRNGYVCGGSLLRINDDVEASDMVLTAAHCLGKNADNNDYRDWTLAANLHLRSEWDSAETRNVVKAEYKYYDIAVMKLDKPVNFTDTVRPVCLPEQDADVPVGKFCMSVGWGTTQTGQLGEALQQLITPVHDPETCEKIWKNYGAYYDEKMMVCAGPMNGLAGICGGDSGGPLVCRSEAGNWVQYGLVNYSVGGGRCVAENMPAVYAKVSASTNWIKEKIQSMSSLAEK